jgi:hypothetical protein
MKKIWQMKSLKRGFLRLQTKADLPRMFVNGTANMAGGTKAISLRKFIFRLSKARGLLLNILPFRRPKRKKSVGIKSGDGGGEIAFEIILSREETLGFFEWTVRRVTSRPISLKSIDFYLPGILFTDSWKMSRKIPELTVVWKKRRPMIQYTPSF